MQFLFSDKLAAGEAAPSPTDWWSLFEPVRRHRVVVPCSAVSSAPFRRPAGDGGPDLWQCRGTQFVQANQSVGIDLQLKRWCIRMRPAGSGCPTTIRTGLRSGTGRCSRHREYSSPGHSARCVCDTRRTIKRTQDRMPTSYWYNCPGITAAGCKNILQQHPSHDRHGSRCGKSRENIARLQYT